MKIYLDMDGVLVNFDQGVTNLGEEFAKGLSDDALPIDKQKMYDAIEKAGAAFWANLKWTSDGKDLWDLIKRFNPVLLSSPGKFSFAPSGKNTWVQNNLPGIPLYFSDNKSDYVDPYELSILIDDSKNNIGGWEGVGGEGILHTTAADTERKLLELLWATPEIDINDYF